MSFPSGQVLFYEDAASATLLETSESIPVWPVAEHELPALRALVQEFGGSLRRAAARPAEGTAETARGSVAVLGAELEPLGRLYAHLTGRRFGGAPRLDELESADVDVVVVLTKDLTPPLLEALYPRQATRRTVGIILGATPEELKREVLLRAASARLHGPLSVAWKRFHASRNGPAHTGGEHVLGPSDDPAAIRAAFGAGAGVLTVHTHSDGVDAPLAAGLSLCRADLPNERFSPRLTVCRQTGYCYRQKMPVADFMASGRWVSPDEFRCRVLVWSSCNGILFGDDVLDAEQGALAGFLANPRVGAVVAGWGITQSFPTVVEEIEKGLVEGEPLGTAVARFNHSAPARYARERFALFGDPDLALPAQAAAGSFAPAAPLRLQEREPVDWGELAFLRAYLLIAATNAGDDELQRLGLGAVGAVQAYEYAAARGDRLEGAADDPGPALRKSVLQFLCRRGPIIMVDWSELAWREEARGNAPCPHCGIPARVSLMHLRVATDAGRTVLNCPRCGIVFDGPVLSDGGLRVHPSGRVWLSTPRPAAPWTAALLLYCQDDRRSRALLWPAAQDGSPAPYLDVDPGAWPPGAVKTTLFLVDGVRLSIFQAPWHGALIPG